MHLVFCIRLGAFHRRDAEAQSTAGNFFVSRIESSDTLSPNGMSLQRGHVRRLCPPECTSVRAGALCGFAHDQVHAHPYLFTCSRSALLLHFKIPLR
jgi:hypothetical protein